MKQIIKSVYDNDQEIIQAIQKLHLNNEKIELDPTYSKGNIYKGIDEPILKSDLYPQKDNVFEMDC